MKREKLSHRSMLIDSSSERMSWTHQLWLAGPVWAEVGPNCETRVHVCMKISRRHVTPHLLFCHLWSHLLYSFPLCVAFTPLFSICLPTLTSPSTAAPQSLHPSLQCWIIETDWSSCSQLCVRVERDRRERRRQKRGRYGGQAHPCLKRGFCREPQAGCQVCRPCTSGRFLSLWKWVYARADVPSLNV